jgi:hypothetical protein
MTDPQSSGARRAATASPRRALDRLEGEALAVALAAADWSEAPCAGLGRAMARRDLDLATALSVFFGGAPERFNYLPKPHVPDGYRAVARHLDNICMRINSGFYLPAPGVRLARRDALERWLEYQRADRAEGRCGRWVLEETLLEPLFETACHRAAAPVPRPGGAAPALRRALLAPLGALRRRRGG